MYYQNRQKDKIFLTHNIHQYFTQILKTLLSDNHESVLFKNIIIDFIFILLHKINDIMNKSLFNNFLLNFL